MNDAEFVPDEIVEKIKSIAKDFVPFDPLDRCKEQDQMEQEYQQQYENR